MSRFLLPLAACLIAALPLAGCQSPSGQALAQSPAIFTDMRPTSGIDFDLAHHRSPLTILETIGHGAGLLDFDGDGLLDVLLTGPSRVRLYHNLGGWRFQDVTSGSGLKQDGFWSGVAVGDYDNDGWPDLFLAGYNCSALYHNIRGRFENVTAGSGL